MIGKPCLVFALAITLLPVIDAAIADIDVPEDYNTIQEAIDAAAPGDTINVAPGLYRENISLSNTSIRLIGNGGASETILDGVGGTVVHASWTDSEMAGFTITGQFNLLSGTTISIFYGSPWFHDNIIENNSGVVPGIQLNDTEAIIERNKFRHNTCQLSRGVVKIANGGIPVIRNNIFHDNQCDGVIVSAPVDTFSEIANNLFYRNRAGIRHSTSVSSANQSYTNNILIGNEAGLVRGGIALDFNWRNNLVWDNDTDYSNFPDPTGIDGNLNANPLLTDADNGDFHLLAESPAIDRGLALPVVQEDFDGQIRPIDGDQDGTAEYDIGPDEYSPAFGPFPEGTTVFVDTANPAPGNGSEQDPYRDLQEAIDTAGAMEVVGVAAGTYPGPITMKPRVDLVGLGSGLTILDGLNAGSVVICADQTRLEGFTITGAHTEPAIDCTNSAGILIKGNLLTGNNARGIYMSNSVSSIIDNVIDASRDSGNLEAADAVKTVNCLVTIERNRIDGTWPGASIAAIDIDYSTQQADFGFLVKDNTITGTLYVSRLDEDTNAGAGIVGNLFLPASNFGSAIGASNTYFGTILNNTMIGGGVFIFGGDDTVGTVINNIVYDANINNCGNDDNFIGNNNIFSPPFQRGCALAVIGENDNVSIDPLFVDADQGDYRLQPDSPMINAGDTGAPGLPVLDLDGLPRIAGGSVDIGVYEFQGFDIDNDQILDYQDNCTLVANPDQTDSDADGFGNQCDPDLNNDGIVNFLDLAAISNVFFTFDGDADFDPAADFNLDMAINAADLQVMRSHLFGPPGPAGLP